MKPTTSAAGLRSKFASLPPGAQRIIQHIGSLLIGVSAAFVLHYVLYRIGLPLKPFIYVAF